MQIWFVVFGPPVVTYISLNTSFQQSSRIYTREKTYGGFHDYSISI
jgi:hypothetical protein